MNSNYLGRTVWMNLSLRKILGNFTEEKKKKRKRKKCENREMLHIFYVFFHIFPCFSRVVYPEIVVFFVCFFLSIQFESNNSNYFQVRCLVYSFDYRSLKHYQDRQCYHRRTSKTWSTLLSEKRIFCIFIQLVF